MQGNGVSLNFHLWFISENDFPTYTEVKLPQFSALYLSSYSAIYSIVC
jgi:hypothetical protein